MMRLDASIRLWHLSSDDIMSAREARLSHGGAGEIKLTMLDSS